MLRSKFHRPWQPRISGSQQFNPFANTTEAEASFSDEIEEVETEARPGAEGFAPTDGASDGNVKVLSSSVAESTKGKPGWYATWRERLAKH